MDGMTFQLIIVTPFLLIKQVLIMMIFLGMLVEQMLRYNNFFFGITELINFTHIES